MTINPDFQAFLYGAGALYFGIAGAENIAMGCALVANLWMIADYLKGEDHV